MSTLVTYKRLQIVDTPPGPAAGEALNENFQAIDDKMIFNQGTWSSTQEYQPNDLVMCGGCRYLCLSANTDDLPPSGNWTIFGVDVYTFRLFLLSGSSGTITILTDPSLDLSVATIEWFDGSVTPVTGSDSRDPGGSTGTGMITIRGYPKGYLKVSGASNVIGISAPGFTGKDYTDAYDFTTGPLIFSSNGLSADALNDLFKSLGYTDGSSGAVVFNLHADGNPGSSGCDPTIGTNKGWAVET